MTLAINSNMLGQFSDWLLSLLCFTISFFFSSPKILSFSRKPPNLSQKNDDLGLIHRWIVVKFEHHVHNRFPRIPTVGNCDNMFELREIPLAFSFPGETQSCLGKTMIPVSLTVGFHEIWICCWKFNFARFHRWDLRDSICWGRKINRMKTVQVEASIPSLSLWRLGTLLEQLEEKNWRNLREPLEMLLSLAEDTWARLKVRDGLSTIGN